MSTVKDLVKVEASIKLRTAERLRAENDLQSQDKNRRAAAKKELLTINDALARLHSRRMALMMSEVE